MNISYFGDFVQKRGERKNENQNIITQKRTHDEAPTRANASNGGGWVSLVFGVRGWTGAENTAPNVSARSAHVGKQRERARVVVVVVVGVRRALSFTTGQQ